MYPTTPTRRPSRAQRRARRVAPLLLAAAVLLPACGSDGSDGAASDTAPASSTTAAPEPAAVEGEGEEQGEVIEISAIDFEFDGLPETVPVGTRLALANDAETELHELVVFALADDETRSAEELMKLPEQELGPILGQAPPTMVLLAAPGGEQIDAVGDGTLTEPGRYLVMCSIPTGVDPAAYLEAAAGGEQPTGFEGIPHFAHGMFGEVTVD